MAKRNGTSLKGEKPGRRTLVKIDGLWVHRGSVRPDAGWDRVIAVVRDGRIASVLKA